MRTSHRGGFAERRMLTVSLRDYVSGGTRGLWKTDGTFRRASRICHALALIIVGWTAWIARADTAIWIGPPTGDWSQPSNWSGGVVPNNGSPAGTTYDVFVDAGSAQASEVLVDQSFTISNFSISTGDAVSIADGFNLSLAGSAGAATLSNMGTRVLQQRFQRIRLDPFATDVERRGSHRTSEPGVVCCQRICDQSR